MTKITTTDKNGHVRRVMYSRDYGHFTDVYLDSHCECHDAVQGIRSVRVVKP